MDYRYNIYTGKYCGTKKIIYNIYIMLEFKNSKVLLLILILVVYYMYNIPNINQEQKEKFIELENHKKVDMSKCSLDCCGNQWPISFDLDREKRINAYNTIGSNLTCSGINGAGCVCLQKASFDNLRDRGNNSKCKCSEY